MRDDFNQDTKLLLAHRASLVCSNPDCSASTAGPQNDPLKALNLGVAAHITAASEGGARYDATLSSEERRSSENGIWLCQNCAKLVDNDESRFPAKLLRAWKTVREDNALHSIGKTAQRSNETEAQRKARRVAQWTGKRIALVKMASPQQELSLGIRPWGCDLVTLLECDEFSVRVRGDGWDSSRSIAMRNIEIGHNDKFDCLELMEYNR